MYAIEFTIASADASKVNIDSSIKGSGTEGYVKEFDVSNRDGETNGGTRANIREFHVRESGNDVVFSGYVAMKQMGTKDVTLEIPINDMIST